MLRALTQTLRQPTTRTTVIPAMVQRVSRLVATDLRSIEEFNAKVLNSDSVAIVDFHAGYNRVEQLSNQSS
jgi:hypothetical protein